MSDSVLMGNTMHLDPIEESTTKANRRCATSPCATVSKIAGAVKEDEIDDNLTTGMAKSYRSRPDGCSSLRSSK